jgi:Na+/phosphate symporter
MRRNVATLTTLAIGFLLLAPVAAFAQDHGQGTWGETSEQVVTNAGFIIIAFFPLLALVLSLILWRLEKRKDARKKNTKKLSSDWQSGW